MLKDFVRAQRTARGITQAELGRALGATQVAVCKWESGKSMPAPDLIIKLADFFNVSVDEVMGIEKKDSATKELSEAKQAMLDLIDSLSDEQVARLYEIAKAALAM